MMFMLQVDSYLQGGQAGRGMVLAEEVLHEDGAVCQALPELLWHGRVDVANSAVDVAPGAIVGCEYLPEGLLLRSQCLRVQGQL